MKPQPSPTTFRLCVLVFIIVLGLAAVPANDSTAQIRQVATAPWSGTDAHPLETVSPDAAGMDAQQLQSAAAIAHAGNSDSLVVLRKGKIVFQKYWNGKTADDVQQMYSATKSPFSFVVGRAIKKGYIKSLDQRLVDFVPELYGKGREALTFRNVMAMESGLEQSRAMDTRDGQRQLSQLEAVLERAVTKEPYTWYHYNNAAYRALFTALERASNMTIPELTRQELFEPLGMKGAYWVELREGGPLKGYQSIRMRPQDLAKVGQVMLNHGRWGGKRYLPRRYVKRLSHAPAAEANPSYGLFWHLNRGAFFLSYFESDRMEGNLMPGTPGDAIANYGSRGQLIVAIPSLDLVWVRTGQEIPSTIWEPNSFVTKLSAAVVDAVH